MDSSSDGAILLRIHLQDSYASSTTIRVTNSTAARDVCHVIDEKLGIPEGDRVFDTLICVCTGFDGKINQHWLKTLKSDDTIIRFQNKMLAKRKALTKNTDIINTMTCNWYYKDIRSAPLQLDGETSGNSSSEGEEEIALNDLIYLGSGDRRAVLQKRSSRDPNLWRRRLCVLNDKLWCVNLKKKAPWATCIPLDGQASLQDNASELQYPHGIIVRCSGGNTHFLRASSASEQHIWCDELQDRVAFGGENSVLYMAEMIICDEEKMRTDRRNKILMDCLLTGEVKSSLTDLWPELCMSRWGVDDGVEEGSPKEERGGSDEGGAQRTRELSTEMSQKISDNRMIKNGRRCFNMLHCFHEGNRACALAIALMVAIDNYKGAFRHDISVEADEMWRLALSVYVEHVLPFLSSTSLNGGSSDGKGDAMSISDVVGEGEDSASSLIRQVVTRVHEEVYENVRKVGISKIPDKNVREREQQDAAAADVAVASSSYWFWPPAVTAAAAAPTAGASSSSSKKTVSKSSSRFVTCGRQNYEILNMTTKPQITMFDEIAECVMSELENDD
jgi:hypothetical protein